MIFSYQKLHAQEEFTRTEFVILIDEAHGPFFGYKELKTTLKYVNETLREKKNITIYVYSLDGKINASTMIGVDLLLIPPTDGSVTYTKQEATWIGRYVMTGGALLILGAPYIKERKENPDVSVLNNLMLLSNLSLGFDFYFEAGVGDLVRDEINGQGDIIFVKEEYAADDIRSLFNNINGSLIVRSSSLRIYDSKDLMTIKMPSTSYRVDGNGDFEYNNSGQVIFASKEVSDGLVVALGFGEAFTNLTGVDDEPWNSIEENVIFFTNLIEWMLRLDRWTIKKVKPAGPLYIYILIAALPFAVAYPYARVADKRREELEKKRKEEVKISEILKKIREKEKQ